MWATGLLAAAYPTMAHQITAVMQVRGTASKQPGIPVDVRVVTAIATTAVASISGATWNKLSLTVASKPRPSANAEKQQIPKPALGICFVKGVCLCSPILERGCGHRVFS
jgi:hypothetical protein